MDKRQYFENLKAKITQYEDQMNVSRAAFLNANTPKEIVDTLSNVDMLTDEESIQKAIALLKDTEAGSGPRILALSRLTHAIGNSGDLMIYILGLLANDKNDPELREAVMRCLQIINFSSTIYNALRPNIINVYRGLVKDSNQQIRESAIASLAQSKDEFVQNLLLKGLSNPAAALVPEELAVHLLGYDVHANVFPVLRNVLAKSGNNESRVQAAYLLGDDPEARNILLDVVNNKKERFEVRKNCLLSLKNIDSNEFIPIARNVAVDINENDDLRAVSLEALSNAPVEDKKTDTEFKKSVKEMSKTLISTGLKLAIKSYLKVKTKNSKTNS